MQPITALPSAPKADWKRGNIAAFTPVAQLLQPTDLLQQCLTRSLSCTADDQSEDQIVKQQVDKVHIPHTLAEQVVFEQCKQMLSKQSTVSTHAGCYREICTECPDS